MIMLARMLAIAALVFAFANPFFPSATDSAQSGAHASIYIDNSPSMSGGEQQNSHINKARNQAVDIIKNLPENAKIQILSNDFQGRQLRYFNKSQAIEMVDAITPSYALRKSDEIVNRIQQAQEKEDGLSDLEVFWFSDFQNISFSSDLKIPENWHQTAFPIRFGQDLGNIAIDSVWFDQPILQPGFDQELYIKISSSGGSDSRKVAINLSLDDKLQGAKETDLNAGESKVLTFTMRVDEPKSYQGKVAIDAGSPYFDNQLFFTYRVDRPFQILLTGSTKLQSKFNKLYSDSIYDLQFTDLESIDYSTIPNYDLIILNAPELVPSGFAQALKLNLDQGKTVVLIPSTETPDGVNDVLSALKLPILGPLKPKANGLEVSWKDDHFKGVFNNTPEKPSLPVSNEHYQYNNSIGYPLVKLEDGNPLVSRIPVSSGNIILLSGDLESNTLPNHPIFVPLMLNSALFSRSNQALYTLSGKIQGPIYKSKGDSPSPLSLQTNDSELIPRQRQKNQNIELYDLPSELEPDIYEINQGQDQIGYLALNAPPEESNWNFLSDQEIANHLKVETSDIMNSSIKEAGFVIGQRYQGTSLWKWFLLTTLLFLIIEIALIKLWK